MAKANASGKAKPKIYGPAARRRIDRAVLRDEARTVGRGPDDPPAGRGRTPRTYRRFTLTENLNAGGSASVEWSDGTTGTVTDPDTCCWGLEGESGEAVAVPAGDDAVEWYVTKNPGQGTYPASAKADTTGVTAQFEVDVDGNTRTVTATIRTGAIPAGEKIPVGGAVFLGHFRGTWYATAIVTCTVEDL